MIAQKLDSFLKLEDHSSPFYKIIKMEESGTLLSNLKLVKMGKYRVLHKAYLELASRGSDFLKTCTPNELENITGISFKTSRFFITHSRINSNTAVIDTHMLKFLSNYISVPKNTSMSSKTYSMLEQKVLSLAQKYNMTPADFDLKVWSYYSSGEYKKIEFDLYLERL